MASSNATAPLSKVAYTPIEAAIRWSELDQQEEREILDGRGLDASGAARWPDVQLNLERILDAIRNHELPATIDSRHTDSTSALDESSIRIRHVDLRSWLTRFYPEHRPTFLFGSLEVNLKASIPIDAVNALLIEREALRAQAQGYLDELRSLRGRQASVSPRGKPGELGPRAESTYLHILGSLLTLVLGRTPTGQHYSRFRSQESIITAMVAENGNLLGISERTLEEKFAAARRALNK